MKPAWYNRKWATISFHLAAWIFFFSLPYLLRSPDNEKPAAATAHHGPDLGLYFTLVMSSIWAVLFYLNVHRLIPAFIFKKKYWEFALVHAFIFIVILGAVHLFSFVFFGRISFNYRSVFFNFLIYLFIFGLSTAYRLIGDKIKSDTLLQERQNEMLKTELSLLRSQVNPHFMFNVLNNMVALARKQSDLLEPSLIKLSSLMRYMLYEADEEKVSIEKEMDYLQSFIDLQQQRFGKKVKVTVHMHSGSELLMIEPMLLIPFVENAFKHGTGIVEDAAIDIRLEAEKNRLLFAVSNRFDPNSAEIKDNSSGIGLANVKRRLNLLYGKKHTLTISSADHLFSVQLLIILA